MIKPILFYHLICVFTINFQKHYTFWYIEDIVRLKRYTSTSNKQQLTTFSANAVIYIKSKSIKYIFISTHTWVMYFIFCVIIIYKLFSKIIYRQTTINLIKNKLQSKRQTRLAKAQFPTVINIVTKLTELYNIPSITCDKKRQTLEILL